MGLEILTAQELYERGEIDAFEVQDPHLFGNGRIMQFSDPNEAVNFAYAFAHRYLVPKYGLEEAAKFPIVKTGPARKGLLGETLGIVREPSPNPIWFAIPDDRFSEVEEFLKQYNSE